MYTRDVLVGPNAPKLHISGLLVHLVHHPDSSMCTHCVAFSLRVADQKDSGGWLFLACQQASVAGGRCRTQLNKAQQCFALAKGSACSFLQVFQSRTAPKMPNEKHVLAEMHLSPATCCSCMENLRDGSVCPFALELHPACWLLPTAAVKLAALPSRPTVTTSFTATATDPQAARQQRTRQERPRSQAQELPKWLQHQTCGPRVAIVKLTRPMSSRDSPATLRDPTGLLGMGPARLPVGDASLGALHGASMAPALPLASSKRGAKQLKGRCPCELTCTQ